MNPKRTIFVGVLVLMMAMAMIPVASALTITRTQYDLVPGMGNAETYATTVGDDGKLYVAGINQYDHELAVYSWGGQGTIAKEEATIDMEGYTYTPTDALFYDGKLYISTMNTTNIGLDAGWETNLYVFDPDDADLSIAEVFPNAFLVQMAILDDELVVAADQNRIYSSDDGASFATHDIIDQVGFETGTVYVYDTYILGIASMGDNLYVETRNCTSYNYSQNLKLPNQPMSAPNQLLDVFTPLADTVEIYETDDLGNFSVNTTQLTLSRSLNFRTAIYANYSNPLYAMPNGEAIAVVANSAVYGFDEDYAFARYYNGDSANFNPTPVFGSPTSGANKANQLYVNTINSANQAPACPATLFELDRGLLGERPVQKLKVNDQTKVKVMQGFEATSAITTTRVNYIVDTTTGKTDEIFVHSEYNMWDGLDYAKGSYVVVTSTGVFTYHAVTLDLTGAINSLFLALLIIGLILIAFGIASWNKGFEDVLALSLGGAIVTDAILLYMFPTLYLSWLLLLIPIVTFFGILYFIIKGYHLNKLDFRLQQKDALILLAIVVGLAVTEYFTGFIAGASSPFWLPP